MLAMGNKYYDAAIFYIPLMSMNGSFMAETARKAGIGIGVDPNKDDFLDRLFQDYIEMDKGKFRENCDKELERVLDEYNFGSDLVRKLTNSEGKE